MSKEKLRLEKVGNHFEVYDENSGFYFLHDFSFSKIENPENTDKLEEEMHKELPEFLRKYQHIATSTESVFKSKQNIGLFYSGNLDLDQVNAFFEIYDFYYGKNSMIIHLPLLQKNQCTITHQRVFSTYLEKESEAWSGDNDSWNKAISQLF